MNRKSNSEQYSSILYIIIGLLLVIFRSQTLNWVMSLVGAFFVIAGILDVIKKNWTSGAVNLIIGIAILVLGWLATQIVLLVLGILIAVKGVLALMEVLKRKTKKTSDILYPAFSIIVGILLAFGNGLDIIIVIVGILLAANGVIGLMNSMKK